MNKEFQIFETEQSLIDTNVLINSLLCYPTENTEKYRDNFEHPTSGLWAGVVDDELITACSEMTQEERLEYYDADNLKAYSWMEDNGWFPEDEI